LAAGGRLETFDVAGPRGGRVPVPLGLVEWIALSDAARAQLDLPDLGPGATIAVVDLASASGLALLPIAERDPWRTTTRGTGELIARAVGRGAQAVVLGVGGSATNDLGAGALAALGLRFEAGGGHEVPEPSPASWPEVVRVAGTLSLPALRIACDVSNPLLGPRGATATFGPQKGLRAADLPALEAGVARMAKMLAEACGQPIGLADQPGAGAAGGAAFGLMTAAGARLVPGFELVSAWLDLPARVAAADIVITGEGRFDSTSFSGKAPGALRQLARNAGKKVLVFAGRTDGPGDESLHAISPPEMPLAEALPRTAELLAAAIARVF